ncbi:MAG: choice-of-anchor tandem repeat GloVer-containing protein, partial [Terriglobales bacterium]
NPAGSLAIDASGSVYGTTYLGGTYGLGTVFKVDSSGNETVLYSFNPGVGDGYEPFSGLVRDAAGNLYGATLVGGTNGLGTVFEINTSGTETVIHNFPSNSQDGAEPWAGLVLDGKGNLYGTTYQGGADNYGTVFKISRAGTETVLYSFGPPPDGEGPTYGNNVIVDSAGNLYGMTASGGAYGLGTIYKIDANGNETVLHSFSGPDGRAPYSGLAFDPAGNLYGTTSAGGAYGGGVIFRITP